MEETNNKKITIVLIAVVAVAGIAIVLYFFKPSVLNIITKPIGIDAERPVVVEENLVIPNTERVTGSDARTVQGGAVAVALVPKTDGEKVIVEKAVLTVKGSHELAFAEAGVWARDAKPAFIKSLGAVTLDGKSSQWQILFSSASKKGKGYEVIIQADQVVSQKEIDSNTTGADLPGSWMDSGLAVQTLQAMPQYASASISTINFFYNVDAKEWRYGFSTSIGVTSVRL